MHCISHALKRKEKKPLMFKQTLWSRFTCLACQHFSFHAKKTLDQKRPFSLALRVVSLFSYLPSDITHPCKKIYGDARYGSHNIRSPAAHTFRLQSVLRVLSSTDLPLRTNIAAVC